MYKAIIKKKLPRSPREREGWILAHWVGMRQSAELRSWGVKGTIHSAQATKPGLLALSGPISSERKGVPAALLGGISTFWGQIAAVPPQSNTQTPTELFLLDALKCILLGWCQLAAAKPKAAEGKDCQCRSVLCPRWSCLGASMGRSGWT